MPVPGSAQTDTAVEPDATAGWQGGFSRVAAEFRLLGRYILDYTRHVLDTITGKDARLGEAVRIGEIGDRAFRDKNEKRLEALVDKIGSVQEGKDLLDRIDQAGIPLYVGNAFNRTAFYPTDSNERDRGLDNGFIVMRSIDLDKPQAMTMLAEELFHAEQHLNGCTWYDISRHPSAIVQANRLMEGDAKAKAALLTVLVGPDEVKAAKHSTADGHVMAVVEERFAETGGNRVKALRSGFVDFVTRSPARNLYDQSALDAIARPIRTLESIEQDPDTLPERDRPGPDALSKPLEEDFVERLDNTALGVGLGTELAFSPMVLSNPKLGGGLNRMVNDLLAYAEQRINGLKASGRWPDGDPATPPLPSDAATEPGGERRTDGPENHRPGRSAIKQKLA